ncbi:MAG: ATP synthase F0 subunit C [Sporolactobacillus sp.]|jgi:F-type H+-transporting ATPase subunit c|nr:ATP synthase F0 subunit C [Sporolactobacillus sp.]MCI1881135.1 ATP synthase F0 subunit C [Sporolactobacillus sp.]
MTTVFAGAIMIAFGAVAAAIGDCVLFSRYMDGIARQPEARGVLFGQTMILFGLIEALPIISIAFGILALFGLFG